MASFERLRSGGDPTPVGSSGGGTMTGKLTDAYTELEEEVFRLAALQPGAEGADGRAVQAQPI